MRFDLQLHGDLDVQMPPHIADPAPSQINALSDGELSYPECPQYGLGTAGIHWPTRLTDYPNASPTSQEEDYGQVDILGQSIDIQAGLRVRAPSSGRTELFATVIASLANIPMHLGLDNLAVVNKGSRLIAWAQRYPALPPPGPPQS